MAQTAVAHDAVRALRRAIARIEGRPDEGLREAVPPGPAGRAVLRQDGTVAPSAGRPATGAAGLDALLDGGLPAGGLLEVTGTQARDAAAAAGFGLCLAGLYGRGGGEKTLPLLWIGTASALNEIGAPYLPGLRRILGPGIRLLLARPARLAEALWIAEEAAGTAGIGAVLLEVLGAQPGLDLTATRRLHRRAQEGRRPMILLRHAAAPEPTAAPFRLAAAPAPARPRGVFGQALAGTIGPPAFTVTLSKSRHAACPTFILDWNADDRRFTEREPENPRAVVSPPRHRVGAAPTAGPVLAFGPGPGSARRRA